jgi:AbiV family abortive infection protein
MSVSIPVSKLEEGIQKSFENASRYLDDALFLFRNKKYQSSILLSMLSYEESGKTMMLIDYKEQKKKITKTQWIKKFCSHTTKNLTSLRAIWQEADLTSLFPDQDIHMSKFQQDWKDVFTYVDYDFENLKWTSPLSPESFFYYFSANSVRSFCISAMSQASEALKLAMKKVETYSKKAQ